MTTSSLRIDEPKNEPVLEYRSGSPERAAVKAALTRVGSDTRELPCIIGGDEVKTESIRDVVMPHAHARKVGRMHVAGETEVTRAIEASVEVRRDWANWPYEDRAAVFSTAADLLSGPYRAAINAATMLGQSKTVHQAEIDAACELIDFLRFNVYFGRQILDVQPLSAGTTRNWVDYRGLDGFVTAITPFNFTAIAGNLPTAPALMGNTVIWKPSPTQALSAQVFMDVLQQAGLPPGVINLLHGHGPELEPAIHHPNLGGIHFTGSTQTFEMLWKKVSSNIANYHSYPRIVGETGGKDFIVAHASADPQEVAVATVRGAFEYQGQKCSAVSRVYVPKGLWPKLSERLVAEIDALRVGDVADFTNFMGAVIDARAFAKIKGYIELARESDGATLWKGGECDDSVGYFVQPTVVLVDDPGHRLMTEEVFGPVVSIYVYEDSDFADVLKLCDESTAYGLTGAIFARSRGAVRQAKDTLRYTAGNFYINDKPTGSVVNQQPFGGSRRSGTNDKAGSMWNLMRWVSPRAIKENHVPPRAVAYPFMQEP